MSSTTTIAIAGFTGRMARLITDFVLQDHPNAIIHGICRSTSKIGACIRFNPRVRLFGASSTDISTIRAALAGTSVCICCYLGDSKLMVDGQKVLIDACIEENVPRYIASDYTFDYRPLELGDYSAKDSSKHIHPYLQEKEKSENIRGVHILNGAFMEFVWNPLLGVVNAEEGNFRYHGIGDEQLEMTAMKDTARFVAAVSMDPKAVGAVKYRGDSKSIKKLAHLYQEAFGVEPSIQRLDSPEDLHENMTSAFKKNPRNGFAWIGLYGQYWMSNGQTLLGDTDNGRYPEVVPTTVEEFLKGHTKESLGKSTQF
ncbi:hypothetical protein BOTCAL_0017g00210 [Botryotinia calthae]|uniref:NmrA-like domain-containing protein n=1 Tax=Botryotinia calthae TaxID=38488 RepID=A0A4Y8DI05_9HELO|nr:hypothetical protein BOTCAL_0017g00210 [Botryotinia calthae]